MDMGVVFGQMLVLLAMMLVGYLVYKKGWLDDTSGGRLSKLVVNVFNPILVINGVLGQSSQDGGNKVLQNLGFVLFYFVLIILVSILLPFILRAGRYRKSLYQGMSVFGNLGFMGIPVIKSIFGDKVIIYVAFYILIYNLLIYTYGVFLARRAGKEWAAGQRATGGESIAVAGALMGAVDGTIATVGEKNETEKSEHGFFRRMINPGVVAALIAVLLFVTGLSVPEPVSTFCDYMGNTTIPLSMILNGVSVAQADLKAVFGEWRMYAFVLLRMIVLPIAVCLLLQRLLRPGVLVDSVVFGVFIIELAMPIGSMIGMLMREEKAEADFCMRAVVLTTLASIVTIPVVCAFL